MHYDLSFETYLEDLRYMASRSFILRNLEPRIIRFSDREHYDKFYWRHHQDTHWFIFTEFAINTRFLLEILSRVKPQVATGLMCHADRQG